jgi:MFS family permease
VDVLRNSGSTVLLAAGSYTGISALGYIGLVYYVSYASRVLGLSLPVILMPLLVAAVFFGVSVVAFARWSDRIGRRRLMLWGNASLVAWSAAFFPLLDTRSIPLIWIALIVMLVLQGAYIGTQPAVFAELFPAPLRYSGASLSNTLGTILGGAPAPFIAAALYDTFRSSNAVGVYITILAMVSWVCVLGFKETRERPF